MKRIFSYLSYLVLTFSIVVNVILSIAYNGKVTRNADPLTQNNLAHFKNSFPLERLSTNFPFNVKGTFFINKNNDRLKFEDLALKKPTLFFRVPRYSCPVCVNREIKAMKNLSDSIHGSNRMIVLTAYENLRDYFVFLKSYQLDIPFYNVPNLDIPSENQEHPFFFMLDCNNSIQNVFFPLQQDESYSATYYNSVVQRYLSNSCSENRN